MKNVEHMMRNITDFFNKSRPSSFVKKFQIVLIFITLIIITYMLAIPFLGQPKISLGRDGVFSEGKQAPVEIVSSKDIIYIDDDKTKLEKQKASQSTPYSFDRDYSVLEDGIKQKINEDIKNLQALNSKNNSENLRNIRKNNNRWNNRSNNELEQLIKYKNKQKISSVIKQYTNLIFSSFCVMRDSSSEIVNLKNVGGIIKNIDKNSSLTLLEGDKIIPRSYLYYNTKTMEYLDAIANTKLQKIESEILPIVKALSISYIYNNVGCVFNSSDTEKNKILAMNQVRSINSKIATGEIIVRANELITPEIYQKLLIINQYATNANTSSILSIFIIQTLFVGIIIAFLKKYKSKRLNDVSSNIIIFSLIWIFIFAVYIAFKFYFNHGADYQSVYYFALFVPISTVCLLIAFVYDEQLSIAAGFYLSFFVFIASRYNATSFTISIVVSIVCAGYGPKIKNRIDFLKSGLILSFAQILVATSGYLFDSRDYWVSIPSQSFLKNLINSNIFRLYLLCFLNGFICSTATQFILPILESIFNLPTRFKLMELADTSHPLIQELLTRAPSTYTHTFVVAALSERAARNLNLDVLLTRAGVYFHDIGKIPNAGFFVENQHLIPKPENIDKNDASKAAKIVIDHVLDGIEMAKKARLPKEIISFIPEHHGTSTMAFFYHKALFALSKSQRKKLNKKDFQYPGPKPQRKETGIVMIADSVEAASRSLEEITPSALDELIQKIINIKLNENQLDESGLTIGDLQVIKTSFKEVLLSNLHSRPKYPKLEDTIKLEKSTKPQLKKIEKKQIK